MDYLFHVINTHWIWAGPIFLGILLVMFLNVIRDLFRA